MSQQPSVLRVALLHFDPDQHCFEPSLSIVQHVAPTTTTRLKLSQAQHFLGLDTFPSDQWLSDFTKWRDWKTPHANNSQSPIFESPSALHRFNDIGKKLSDRLDEELKVLQQSHAVDLAQKDVQVDEYCKLYCSVEVGEGWWHVRDCCYGCVVPIQHLPVSNGLKSRLQEWRFEKTQCLLKSERDRNLLQAQCRDLEEHLLWELNVRSCEPASSSPAAIANQVTAETVEDPEEERKAIRLLATP